jgi:hypothetical protein
MNAITAPSSIIFDRPADVADALRASAEVRFLDIPERTCLMFDGRGAPEGSPDFAAAMGALYPVAYTLHFDLKRAGRIERVGLLEGLWRSVPSMDLPAGLPSPAGVGGGWDWTLLIGLPEFVTTAEIEAAVAAVRVKRAPPGLDRLRVERWAEGPCAQILHVGPYDAEAPTIARLHDAIHAAGLRPRGAHHEIYLGDPRRSAPERLKTVLRQPVG